MFLQNNNITDISELDEKVKAMSAQNKEMQDELKPIERRLTVLDENIKHTENYTAYRNIYKKYENIDNQNKRGLYRRDNYHEILQYEAAIKYFKSNSFDKNLPLAKWRAERGELTAKKAEIDKIYLPLKDETADIERIRKNVFDIIHPQTQDISTAEKQSSQRKKSYGMEI
jgi:vacuolar-type H+-ATPase subunit I/STV1